MLKRFAQVAGLTLTLGMVAVPVAHADTRFSLQIGTRPVAVAPPGYVWQPPYRVWTGYGYRWVPGAWVPAPYLRGGRDEHVYRDWDGDRGRAWDRRGAWDRGRDDERGDWRSDRNNDRGERRYDRDNDRRDWRDDRDYRR